MPDRVLRRATAEDFDRIVALNDAAVQHTSAMDVARLRELADLASHVTVVYVDGHVGAFLLAMRENAAYVNDNYAWFAARFSSFIYVDRIVVATEYAGLGLGRLLYEDLFATARAAGVGTVCCEYNIEPPNLPSQRFHDRFGFRELATQWVANGTKRVSLQAVAL